MIMSQHEYIITKKQKGISKGTLTFSSLTSCLSHISWCLLSEEWLDEIHINGPSVSLILIKVALSIEDKKFLWIGK